MNLPKLSLSVVMTTLLLLNPWPAFVQSAPGVEIKEMVNGPVPSVVSSINLPYPPDLVWSVVSNPQYLTQHAPSVKKVVLVSQSGKTQDLNYTVKLNMFLPEFNYVLHYQPKGIYTLGFNRVSGSFKTVNGFWKVVPQAGGKSSTLIYSLALDPGFAAPRALVNQVIKMDVPHLMQHARGQVALFASAKSRTVAINNR